VLPVFVLVLPGLIAFALYPQLFHVVGGKVTNGDIAYPTMIVNLLPTGLVGLMIAALLAALMGAMSSVFNSASTMVTLDFYKKFRPAPRKSSSFFSDAVPRPPWSFWAYCGCRILSISARSFISICRACRRTSVRRLPCAYFWDSFGRG